MEKTAPIQSTKEPLDVVAPSTSLDEDGPWDWVGPWQWDRWYKRYTCWKARRGSAGSKLWRLESRSAAEHAIWELSE